MNKIILDTSRYTKPTEAEAREISRLHELFFEDDHNLLRGGKLKKKDRDSLNNLYYKFFKGIDNHDWGGSILSNELENLKHDGICKNNSNKAPWSMSIVLDWYSNLDEERDIETLFCDLSARESHTRMIKYFYKVVKEDKN